MPSSTRVASQQAPLLLIFSAPLPCHEILQAAPLRAIQPTALPAGSDRLGLLTGTLLTKRIRMQGFIIFDDYGPRFGEFLAPMSERARQGRIRYREDVVEGLENAPQAFIGMLDGSNFGKLMVRIAGE